jgi:hypothetical protein
LEVVGGKRWQIPPVIFLEQIETRFPITVTSVVTEADRGRGADVKDSWQTRKEIVQHLQITRFTPAIYIQLFFHTVWADGKNQLKKFIKKNSNSSQNGQNCGCRPTLKKKKKKKKLKPMLQKKLGQTLCSQ